VLIKQRKCPADLTLGYMLIFVSISLFRSRSNLDSKIEDMVEIVESLEFE
jgi:hypothetical protein